MRFLLLIKVQNTPAYESGEPPPPALEAAMGNLIGEWSKDGVFLSGEGLTPTSQGTRVRGDRKITVIDGPFSEAKEVIGGFFILDVKSKADAVQRARRFVDLHAEILGKDFVCEVEVRGIA